MNGGSQRVTRLWRGAINENEKALHLLLIVDYIVDWARDIYREGVIHGLIEVAGLDSRSLERQDSDILSTMDLMSRWILDQQNGVESGRTAGQEAAEVKDALCSFDTAEVVVRDIRYIRNRFVGIRITEDNIGDFLSTGSEWDGHRLARILFQTLSLACRVKGEALAALETDWTGNCRGLEWRDQEATFVVVATAAAYLAPDWAQTRELAYIAVEEGLVGLLFMQYLNEAKHDFSAMPTPPVMDTASLRNVFLAFRHEPAGANLLACISRTCVLPQLVPAGHDAHGKALYEAVVKGLGARVRTLACTLCGSRKTGSYPFLRVTSALDVSKLSPDTPPLSRGEVQDCAWFRPLHDDMPPYEPLDIPETPGHGVLIATSGTPREGTTARLCLFGTDPAAVDTRSFPFRELTQSEPPWVLHTKSISWDLEDCEPDRWNCGFEHHVKYATPDDALLPRLKAFVKGLEIPEAERDDCPGPSSAAQGQAAAHRRSRETEPPSVPAPKRQRLEQPVPPRPPGPVPETLPHRGLPRRMQTTAQGPSRSTSLQHALQVPIFSPGSGGSEADPIVIC